MVMTHSALARSKGQDALDQGTKLYQKGRYLKAVKLFTEATKLDPALIKAWKNLGWAYYKSGQTKKALRIFETIIKIEPHNLKIKNSIGFLFIEKNLWRQAIPHLTQSLKSAPDQNLVRLRLGKAYQKIGQTDRSIEFYKQGLEIQPDHWETMRYLADAYESTGRRVLQISLFKNFLTSNSGSLTSEKKDWISINLSHLIAKRGDEYYRKGRFQKAEEVYKQALNWTPDNITLLQNQGWSLEKQGKYNEAVISWLKIVDRGFTGFQLFHQIANAYFHSGQTRKAQIWYQNAEGMNASNGSIQFRLFEHALDKNNISTARKALKHIFALRDADKVWSMRAGNQFIRHERIVQGLEFFLKRLPVSSNQETTKKVLGRLYSKSGSRNRERGDFRQAIFNYKKALSFESSNAAIYRDLGWLYWQADEKEKCERVWRQYQKKFPDQAKPYNLLARIYLKQKEYQKTLVALKASLSVDPDQPAQKLLQAKALYWDRRYPEALQRINPLAREYPNFISVQYFYGEILIQQQDLKKGKNNGEKFWIWESRIPGHIFIGFILYTKPENMKGRSLRPRFF